MVENFFQEQIRNYFPFEPTPEQEVALEKVSLFLLDRDPESLFLLRGYAGTGKSSLIGAIVKALTKLNQKTVLLAPTGRAAKVFSNYAGHNAWTIHKKIYRQKAFSDEPTGFVLADNLHKHTIFIVDEASMISNDGLDSTSFGSGRLLDDLIYYVYGGEGCRLLLMGDSAQLPPVMQPESPALSQTQLAGYGMNVTSMTLTQVVRQAKQSGILHNATLLREAINKNNVKIFPTIQTNGFPDVTIVRGNDLLEKLEDAYSRDGKEETTVITRSNKRANIFNNGIRNRILWREEELESGDLLMIAKNNYLWSEESKEMDFIANGDLMEIKRVRRVQELHGFRFADVSVYFSDYDLEMDVKILLDTLASETPALPREQNSQLFYSVMEDYAQYNKKKRIKMMKEDPFYNAVQVKYGYAVTCHKAQGGQWKNVFLDLSYVPEEYLGLDFYRWLYTAFTRATERLFIINPAKELLG